jgi:VWFA-related protein
MRFSRIRTACQLFLVCIVAVAMFAQGAAPNGQGVQPSIRVSAQAVALDVVVTTGRDEPAAGLSKQDFRVTEDGKLQTIDLFEEHAAWSGEVNRPAQLPPHTFANSPAAPQADSVNVLLLDSLNTTEADQAFVHKQIVSFIANMKPDTRIAIYTLNTRLRLLQGFTADSSLLKAALSGKGAAPGTTPASRTRDDDLRDKEELSIIAEMVNNTDNNLQAAVKGDARDLADQAGRQEGKRATLTLAALQQLARSLAAVPGRKNVIWFASSFPVSVFPHGADRQTLSGGKEIGDAVRQTAGLLTQSRVAIYPVSAQGILIDPTNNADSGGQPQGDDVTQPSQGEAASRAADTAAMEQLASDTGGEAIYTTNNLSQAMDRAVKHGAHYYTLVYTPTNKELDGRFRRIEARLTQGKLKLAYRRGYYADDAKVAEAKPALDPLPPLLVHGMPGATQILYQARVLPTAQQPAADAARAGANTRLTGPLTRYKVDFAITAAGVDLEPAADGTHSGRIEVALIAYGHDGAAVNWTEGAMNMTLDAATYAKMERDGIPAHLEIDLPAGDLSLATGVYDLGSRRAGTLELPLSAAPNP